ncbi:uncharacterized protein LY89DRAFT_789965 [Mollisia scopiformis]|uniref:BTB domain-containing protein n=1 Tax=Mollisia scopiformis TaxID=149040 RepID=A0A132B435_MOLSC|nr:uncharacterized protein LY89DRAFT_789965 [Mollisia scopiformis]KUJ07175.1 hypothetical protein LY89DRAFT_789965 [Mollisia scopiformis]
MKHFLELRKRKTASSSPADTIPSPPEFTFTPSDARIVVIYKNAPAYVHVSSQAMALASPVWKKIFCPTLSDHPSKVPLDPLQREILKDTPSQELLVELAILCSAYRCEGLLKPWIGGWTERNFRRWQCGSSSRLDSPNVWAPEIVNPKGMQRLMLLGWVFEPDLDFDYYEEAVTWLYQETKEDSLPKIPGNWPLPRGVMGKRALRCSRGVKTACVLEILQARKSAIPELMVVARMYFSYLEKHQEEISYKHNKKCKARILELYIDWLKRPSMNLYPWDSTETGGPKTVREAYDLEYTRIVDRMSVRDLDCHNIMQGHCNKEAKDAYGANWNRMWLFAHNGSPKLRHQWRAAHEMKRIKNLTGAWSNPKLELDSYEDDDNEGL